MQLAFLGAAASGDVGELRRQMESLESPIAADLIREAGAEDPCGWTPLHYAVDGRHRAALAILLGGDPLSWQLKDDRGFTSVEWAAQRGDEESFALLCTSIKEACASAGATSTVIAQSGMETLSRSVAIATAAGNVTVAAIAQESIVQLRRYLTAAVEVLRSPAPAVSPSRNTAPATSVDSQQQHHRHSSPRLGRSITMEEATKRRSELEALESKFLALRSQRDASAAAASARQTSPRHPRYRVAAEHHQSRQELAADAAGSNSSPTRTVVVDASPSSSSTPQLAVEVKPARASSVPAGRNVSTGASSPSSSAAAAFANRSKRMNQTSPVNTGVANQHAALAPPPASPPAGIRPQKGPGYVEEQRTSRIRELTKERDRLRGATAVDVATAREAAIRKEHDAKVLALAKRQEDLLAQEQRARQTRMTAVREARAVGDRGNEERLLREEAAAVRSASMRDRNAANARRRLDAELSTALQRAVPTSQRQRATTPSGRRTDTSTGSLTPKAPADTAAARRQAAQRAAKKKEEQAAVEAEAAAAQEEAARREQAATNARKQSVTIDAAKETLAAAEHELARETTKLQGLVATGDGSNETAATTKRVEELIVRRRQAYAEVDTAALLERSAARSEKMETESAARRDASKQLIAVRNAKDALDRISREDLKQAALREEAARRYDDVTPEGGNTSAAADQVLAPPDVSSIQGDVTHGLETHVVASEPSREEKVERRTAYGDDIRAAVMATSAADEVQSPTAVVGHHQPKAAAVEATGGPHAAVDPSAAPRVQAILLVGSRAEPGLSTRLLTHLEQIHDLPVTVIDCSADASNTTDSPDGPSTRLLTAVEEAVIAPKKGQSQNALLIFCIGVSFEDAKYRRHHVLRVRASQKEQFLVPEVLRLCGTQPPATAFSSIALVVDGVPQHSGSGRRLEAALEHTKQSVGDASIAVIMGLNFANSLLDLAASTFAESGGHRSVNVADIAEIVRVAKGHAVIHTAWLEETPIL